MVASWFVNRTVPNARSGRIIPLSTIHRVRVVACVAVVLCNGLCRFLPGSRIGKDSSELWFDIKTLFS